jgi:hypothetical protein
MIEWRENLARIWREFGENLARLAGFPRYLAVIWPERSRNHCRDNGAISSYESMESDESGLFKKRNQ